MQTQSIVAGGGGFPLRIPFDALSEDEAREMGMAGPLPVEALDEEEDARWAVMPFLKTAVERMCVMVVLAEDHDVEFDPLDQQGLEGVRAMGTSQEDPLLAHAADDYLSALTTLSSMSGRSVADLHRSVAGLYLMEGE